MDLASAATIVGTVPPAHLSVNGAACGARVIGPGTILCGSFEVLTGPLGGGMGQVYRCRHRLLQEERAVKRIRPEGQGVAIYRDLLIAEAASLKKVQHDAVVRYYDVLEDQGEFYLVMDFVEGPSLRKMIDERRISKGQVTALCRRVASGLAAAHAQGVVHMDVSPDNIIVPGEDVSRAVLIDFGIAHKGGDGMQASAFAGKLAYASPEHFGLGTRSGASDVFSLGLVLAEVAGYPVYMGASIAESKELRKKNVAIPWSAGWSLRRFLRPMLHLAPEQRPRAAELAAPPEEEENWVGVGLLGALAGLGYFAYTNYWG